ncbi:MAG: helix-turn-helix domain-containing protein [Pararhodobacter sp.]|nr:helix-turn-helix domain-containing protein [Pararhodobacter sp.]
MLRSYRFSGFVARLSCGHIEGIAGMSVTPSKQETILNKGQAADLIGVSERTLSRLHAEGSGPPRIRIGRQVRYLQSSIYEWLKACELKPVR